MPIHNDVEGHDRNLVCSQKADLIDSDNRPLKLQGSDDVPFPIPNETINSIERAFLYEKSLFEDIPWKKINNLLQETIIFFVFTLLPSFLLYNAVDCTRYSIIQNQINSNPSNLNRIMEFLRWSLILAIANVIYFISYFISKTIPPIILRILEYLQEEKIPLETRRFNLVIKQTSLRLVISIWSFSMLFVVNFLLRKIELKNIDSVPFDYVFFLERGLATLSILFFLLFLSESFSHTLRQSSLRDAFGRRVFISNTKFRLYGKIMTIFNERPLKAKASKINDKYIKKLNNKLLHLIPNHDNEHGLALHFPSDAVDITKLIFIGASVAKEDCQNWNDKRLSVDSLLPFLSNFEKDLLISMLFPLYDGSNGIDGSNDAKNGIDGSNDAMNVNNQSIVDNEFKFISFQALERCIRHIALERERIRIAIIQSIRVQDQLGTILNGISIFCTIIFMARALNLAKSTIFMLLGITYASIQFATLSLLQFMYECCIFIQLSRPFDCGDRVQIASYTGDVLIVEEFNLYTTTFRRTSDGSLLYMANNVIRNQKLIINHRRTMNCWETFTITIGKEINANSLLMELLLRLKRQDQTEFTGNGWLERRDGLNLKIRIEFRNNFQDNSWKLQREQKIDRIIQEILNK